MLTKLNISLVNTDDPARREALMAKIYKTELDIGPSALAAESINHPVRLNQLQKILSPDELLVEYVLAEPNSYALAVTKSSVTSYQLPAKAAIEADAAKYRREIEAKIEDPQLAQKLFGALLFPIREYSAKKDLVIVPDGELHLLPFAALADRNGYVISSHTVDVAPSSTAFALLESRSVRKEAPAMPFLGVAAWTQLATNRNPVLRAVSGPERSQFAPLPDSKLEVETVANDMPRPRTILLGEDATETRFKELSTKSTDVIHLALHGYADLEYPDRSALIFAPETSGPDDGLLQVREIRALHLNAKLVTLSACDTGVGPVGEPGVVNLVNAFIEAGADSVVSTLWELEDHSTKRLMASFYAQLASHQRKVDALRSAQLALLGEKLPPYYWAGFQIVGDPSGSL
jgi:CHAT domain-containing protein